MSTRRRFFLQTTALMATVALLAGCAGLGMGTVAYALRGRLGGTGFGGGRFESSGEIDLRAP